MTAETERRLTGAFAGSLGIRLGAMGLGLGLTVVLARVLGPEDFGVYSLVFALVSILAIPTELGLPQLALRETAAAGARGTPGRLRGILVWSRGGVAIGAVALTLAAVAILALFPALAGPEIRPPFLRGLVLVPLIAFLALEGAILRGLGHVLIGQLAQDILRPALFIALILGMAAVAAPVGAGTALGLHAFAAATALAVSAALFVRAMRRLALPPATPEYHGRAWLLAVVPLALAAGMQQVLKRIDMVMLGMIGGEMAEVGAYRVAVQGAMVLLFVQGALNMVTGPRFARLAAATGATDIKAADRARLARLARLTARLIVLSAGAGTMVFLFFGERLIAVFFGAVYAGAAWPLAILAAGHVAGGFFGPVGLMLNMTGHEAANARGVAVGLGANVALNAALIPAFGMTGAAVATALSLLAWKGLLWWEVRQRIGIDCAALAILPRPPAPPGP